MTLRADIRQALVSRLESAVSAGRSFVKGRPRSQSADETPALFLYSVNERAAAFSLHDGATPSLTAPDTERIYDLRLAVIGSETGDAEAEIDEVIEQVEVAINGDPTLGALVEDCAVSAINWTPIGDSGAPRLAAELQIEITYRADAALFNAL